MQTTIGSRSGTEAMRLMLTASVLALPLMTGCADSDEPMDRQTAESMLVANKNAAIDVEAALDRVARVCMENRGFTVHPPELEFPEQYDIHDMLDQSVLTRPDLSLPAEEIYGISLDEGVETTFVEIDDNGEVQYLEEPSEFDAQPIEVQEEYFEAFYGSSEMTPEYIRLPDLGEAERAAGGCMREAEDVLSEGAYPEYLNHVGLAGAKGATNWETDSRVFDARIEWSICMEESEYEYEKPLEIRMELAMEASGFQQRELAGGESEREALEEEFAEVVMAVAEVDAECHEHTDLQQVQEEVYWEYLIEFVSDHETEYYSFVERTDEMLLLAQDIIESGQMPS